MRRGVWLGLMLALFGAACGDDDGPATTPDTGPMPPPPPPGDGGPGGDSGPGSSYMFPDLPVVSRGTLDNPTAMPADFSCLGMRSAPAAGAVRNFDMVVEDFQTGDPVPEVTVQFFPDNQIADDCSGDCVEAMTDEMGVVPGIGPAGGWFAYRVLAKMGPTPPSTVVGAVQYNEPTPAEGERGSGNSVSEATLRLIPTVFGFRRAAGTALIAGTARDCTGEPIRGALVRMFLSDGTEILEGTRMSDPHHEYFDGDEFPSPDQIHTNVDGLYASANIPVSGAGSIRMETWGVLEAGAAPVLLACEEGRTFADTVTIMNLEPLREDAAAACGSL